MRNRIVESMYESYTQLGNCLSYLLERKDPASVINPNDPTDRYVTGGRTGQGTPSRRLIKPSGSGRRETGQAVAGVRGRLKQYTAGPVTDPKKQESARIEYWKEQHRKAQAGSKKAKKKIRKGEMSGND